MCAYFALLKNHFSLNKADSWALTERPLSNKTFLWDNTSQRWREWGKTRSLSGKKRSDDHSLTVLLNVHHARGAEVWWHAKHLCNPVPDAKSNEIMADWVPGGRVSTHAASARRDLNESPLSQLFSSPQISHIVTPDLRQWDCAPGECFPFLIGWLVNRR